MKTLKALLSSLFFFFLFSVSYGQAWLWTANAFTKTPDDPRCPVATDKRGNAYITGSTQTDTLTIGNTKLTGKYSVTYLAKYNSAGAVVWVKQLNGNLSTGSVATDKSGNVYVGGSFSDTVKIGASTLMSLFGNVFLAKYDSNGNPLWAKQSQTRSRNCYVGIGFLASDAFNNVFATGDFEDTVSFGSFTLTMLNNKQGNDRAVFVVKYDSNGNALWAEQSKTPSMVNYGGNSYSVAADNSGNSYISGGFGDTLSFGSFSLMGAGAFLVKYSPAGTVLWAKQSTGGSCEASSVITDGTNPYITGEFEDSVKFDSHVLSSPKEYSIFVTKYDVNGNAIWAEQSSPQWIGNGLAADAYNHIYLAGATYQGDLPNAISFGNYIIGNPLLKTASFIMELDTTGITLCGSLLNNRSSEALNGIASDPMGNYIYMSSIFFDSLIYNNTTVLGSPQGFSTFVARWQSCTLTNGVASMPAQNASVLLYPNPSNGVFQLEIRNEELGINNTVEVYNILGEKVYSQFLIPNSQFLINLSGQPNGVYLYRVITENGSLIGGGKLVIER